MAASSDISAKELQRRDFILNGNLWKVVFVLMFPLFLYTIFNYVYSIIDTIMCAGISTDAVNAVGALSQVTNMISALGAGLASGGSIMIAREIGKKDYERARKLASTVLTYVMIIALATCAIIIPLAEPLLHFANVADRSIAVGKNYFIISVATTAIVMFNTVYLGIEKAKGSMTGITLLNMAVVIVKVALNAIFLYGFGLADMMYVSLATLIANATLSIYIVIRLASKHYLFHFSFHAIDWTRYTLSKTTFLSFPIFLGKFIFSLGKVVINGLCKNYGDNVVGALGVSNNMGGAITNPISSVQDSESAIISTNLGAKKTKRAIDTFYIGLVYALAIAVIGVVLISVFDTPITMFFARKAGDGIADPEQAAAAVSLYASHISQVFFYEKMGIITLAINDAVLGLLYGFGYTRLSMIINIARVFLFRIPSFLIAQACLGTDPEAGYLVAGISMGASNIAIGLVAIVAIVIVISGLNRRERSKAMAKTLSQEETQALEGYIQGQIASFTHYKADGAWCYEDGVMLEGAYQLYRATRNKKYLDFCIHYYEENIAEDGSLKGFDVAKHSSDDFQSAHTLFFIDSIHHEEKFSKALTLLRSALVEQPRTQSGSFWHKGRYPNQVWLDGLYMAEPYYALEATRSSSLKMRKDVLKQFTNVEKYNYDPSSHLFYHAFDETKSLFWADKTNGRSPNIWLRSVGWLAMASVDVAGIYRDNGYFLSVLPLKRILKEVFQGIDPYQDKVTHLWKDLPLVDNPKNYLETSGSLMLAYSKMKGARLRFLPYEMMAEGVSVFEGVVRYSLKDNHLNNIVQVSGLDGTKRDGSVAYYLSEKVVADDSKGVGPLMMAYAEYLSLPY
jgi:rhamnogalacturonyl hydrolase YesR/Na+-driven multidrug efflux pump